MAGGGAPAPTKGGKRTVDFTVNLVPTIDLLSVLISFLLITAVWTELARINSSQLLPKTTEQPEDKPPDEEKILRLLVADQQVILKFGDEAPVVIKADETAMVTKLAEAVKALKDKIPDPHKQKVQIGANDNVHYSRLIQIMDVMLDNELTGLQVGNSQILEGMMPDDGSMQPGGQPPGGAAPAPGQPG